MEDVKTSFLKLGCKVYALEEVEEEMGIVELEDSIKEFYKLKYEDLKSGLVTEGAEDWDRQLRRLVDHREGRRIEVPQRLFNRPVFVYRDRLCEAKIVMYSPQYVKTSICRLNQRGLPLADYARFELPGSMDEDVTVHLKIKPLFNVPVLFVLDRQGGVIYTPTARLFHSMGAVGANLCVGHNEPIPFFDDGAFDENVNIINMYSLGSDICEIPASLNRPGRNMLRFSIQQVMAPENVIEVVARGERSGSTWTA